MTLGDAIRQARERLGWSQSELARQSGVSQSHISLLEAGNREVPGADVLYKLAVALGTTNDDLLRQAGLAPVGARDEIGELIAALTALPETPMRQLTLRNLHKYGYGLPQEERERLLEYAYTLLEEYRLEQEAAQDRPAAQGHGSGNQQPQIKYRQAGV